jgi:microcystin-dependent protein
MSTVFGFVDAGGTSSCNDNDSYVTLNTAQTITASKTFSSITNFNSYAYMSQAISPSDSSTKLTTSEWVRSLIQSELAAANSVKPGTILMYGGITAPAGYLLCDGSIVLKAAYLDLFTVIQNRYDPISPSFENYFYVPDLRGVYPGMPGTNASSTYDAALATAVLTGPTGIGDYQLQQAVFIDHSHTADYPGNTRKVVNGFDDTMYKTGAQQNPTSTAANLTAPNAYTTIGSVLRPTTLGVNYIIKF